jgi:uncharacterized protein YndB with AHSA1/START domain
MAKGQRLAGPPAADRSLVVERVLDAPRDIVWELLTDPVHAERWWCPKLYTVIELTMDVRPGGAWRKRMRSSDGHEVSNGGSYAEVHRPDRIVFTYAVDGHETVVTLTLVERDGRTKLTLRQSEFPSEAYRDSHRAGWSSTLERLSEYTASHSRQAG